MELEKMNVEDSWNTGKMVSQRKGLVQFSLILVDGALHNGFDLQKDRKTNDITRAISQRNYSTMA